MQCPSCGADDQESWKFCECCGAALQATESATLTTETANQSTPEKAAEVAAARAAATVVGVRCRCGAGPEKRDPLGYCSVCGLKISPGHKSIDPADHREIVLAPNFAAVTDRGKRHKTNQDNVAIAMQDIDGKPAYIMVVCDGLSSSSAAEAASETAANSACARLTAVAMSGKPDLQAEMLHTILAAHKAVCAIPYTPDPAHDGPATTLVAALVMGDTATIGWVGDSRAYLLPAPSSGAPSLVSHDHSWVNAMVDDGEMSMEDAIKSPEAHVITQCLGPTTEDDGSPSEAPVPSVITVKMPESGCLLLCTDGIWNFLDEAKQIAAKLAEHAEIDVALDAVSIAQMLVQYANSCGGRDNITAAALCNGGSA